MKHIRLSHLALRTALQPRQRDYLDKIQRAGNTLLQRVDDIVDLAKIEAGRLTIETTDSTCTTSCTMWRP